MITYMHITYSVHTVYIDITCTCIHTHVMYMYMYINCTCIVHMIKHSTHIVMVKSTTCTCTYTSINIEPKGRTPPNITTAHGSINLSINGYKVSKSSVHTAQVHYKQTQNIVVHTCTCILHMYRSVHVHVDTYTCRYMCRYSSWVTLCMNIFIYMYLRCIEYLQCIHRHA